MGRRRGEGGQGDALLPTPAPHTAAHRRKLGTSSLRTACECLLGPVVIELIVKTTTYLYARVVLANGVTPRGSQIGRVAAEQDARMDAMLSLWQRLVLSWRAGTREAASLGLSTVLPLVLLSLRGTVLQIINWLLPFWSSTDVGQVGQQEMAECISEVFDPQGYYSDLSVLQSHASAVRIVSAYSTHSHIPAHYRAGDLSPAVKAVINQPRSSEVRRMLALGGGGATHADGGAGRAAPPGGAPPRPQPPAAAPHPAPAPRSARTPPGGYPLKSRPLSSRERVLRR